MAIDTSTLNALVTQRIDLAQGLAIFRVAPDGWTLPDFIPGQFAVLGLPESAPRAEGCDPEEPPAQPAAAPHAAAPAAPSAPPAAPPTAGQAAKLIRRSYSIASSSLAGEYMEFYLMLVKSGALTPRLFALRPGDRLWLGPKVSGMFTLEPVPPEANLLLIATGTGLAPYMSMIRTYLGAANSRRQIAIFHGARHSCELGYQAELETMTRLCPRFSYTPILSRPAEEPAPWHGRTGHVQDLWHGHVLDALWGFAPTPENTHIFLCGSPAMIEDMAALLASEGYLEHTRKQPGQVHIERYW